MKFQTAKTILKQLSGMRVQHTLAREAREAAGQQFKILDAVPASRAEEYAELKQLVLDLERQRAQALREMETLRPLLGEKPAEWHEARIVLDKASSAERAALSALNRLAKQEPEALAKIQEVETRERETRDFVRGRILAFQQEVREGKAKSSIVDLTGDALEHFIDEQVEVLRRAGRSEFRLNSYDPRKVDTMGNAALGPSADRATSAGTYGPRTAELLQRDS